MIWARASAGKLIEQILQFGGDVSVAAGGTYINLLRAKKKFGIPQPSSAERLDIGIKLKGKAATDRFEPARLLERYGYASLRVGNPKEIDAEVLSWLKSAYEAAKA